MESHKEREEWGRNERNPRERASSGVVLGEEEEEEEEGRNNFAADRFASQDCEKIFKTVLRNNLKKYCWEIWEFGVGFGDEPEIQVWRQL